jgi:uncharacterized coiled-coil protein SlyX
MDPLKSIADHLPFTLLATTSGGYPVPKMNAQRIIEALVIAVISAMASSFLTVQKLEVRMTYFESEIRQQLTETRSHVDRHTEQLAIIGEQLGELKGRNYK